MSADDSSRPPILAEGVAVRFGRSLVLEDVDLGVERGTTTVLLGPNGAGKSTLLRCLLGAVKPTAGRVRVNGLDPQRRRGGVLGQLGYVPDRPDVHPWMHVADLFRFLKPHYPTWDDARATAACAQLSIPLDRAFSKMSRGEGMKAMLAAALAHRPSVLLLDEPFGGLDPLIREEVLRNVIGTLGEEEECTVLAATHDLEIAARIADRVAVLTNGRIRREGTVDQIGGRGTPTPAARRLHDTLAAAAGEI